MYRTGRKLHHFRRFSPSASTPINGGVGGRCNGTVRYNDAKISGMQRGEGFNLRITGKGKFQEGKWNRKGSGTERKRIRAKA